MTFRGVYKQGVVVMLDDAGFAEGERVEVRSNAKDARTPVRSSRSSSSAKPRAKSAKTKRRNQQPRGGRTLYEVLKPVMGMLNGLPRDFSVNHDHYLYGVPKRKP